MQIFQVYQKYKIMGNLQLHQLRVTAVAKQLSDSLNVTIDNDSLIRACLLHDMGNIIKFDLSLFPEFLEPEGLEYWEQVKQGFIDKYGPDEHHASLEIAAELGASQEVIDIIDSIGFSKIKEDYHTGTIEMKLAEYADMRVGPMGVLSIDERMADGQKRYQHRKDYFLKEGQRTAIAIALHKMEDELFRVSTIQPADVTNESVAPLIEQLKTYEI